MKQIIRLAWSYLKYYKKQTMDLFLGIVLSCALFTGIGSLQKSGNHAARENARTKSGDWHYTLRCDTDWFEEFEKTYQTGEKEQGYCVEQVGLLTMRKVIEEPYEIELDYAEEGYLSMMGRTLKEGRYPAEEGEEGDRHDIYIGWRNIYVVRNCVRAAVCSYAADAGICGSDTGLWDKWEISVREI